MDTDSEQVEVFISHSSKDADVAEALIELVRAALGVPHDKIRCTSVDGYRLPGGASVEDQLRREVLNCRCFIALLTPSSLGSSYVLFELGARWGTRLNCIPLLAKGLVASSLGRPLSSLNALSCSSSAQIHQLLGDMGKVLDRTPGSPAAYDKHLRRLQGFHADGSAQQTGPTGTDEGVRQPAKLGSEAQHLLRLIEEEPDVDQRGIVVIMTELEPGETFFFPRIEYSGSPIGMRSRLFREAVRQLQDSNRLYPSEEDPSTKTRTYEYRPAGQS